MKLTFILLFLLLLCLAAEAPVIVIHGPGVPGKGGGSGGGGPPPSGIAFVQSKPKDAGSITSTTLAFNSGNTAGNLILVCVRQGGGVGGTCAITDTVGNTYTSAQSQSAPGSDHIDYIFYAKNIGAGANTVTVTFEAAHTCRMAIHEYSGLSTTAPLDVKAGTTGSSTALDSGNVSTTSSSELIFGFGSVNNTATFTAGTSYTLRESPGSKIGTEDQIVSSSGTYSASFSISVSDSWSMQIVTFK